MAEKRKYLRHDAIHLLDYQVTDHAGNTGTYSMGRTLDVCADGLQLETQQPFKLGTQLLLTVGLQDQLVDLLGEVTYCRKYRGLYLSGITFLKMKKDYRRVLNLYIEAFEERKKQQ